MKIFKQKQLVLLNVYYYIPQTLILNEFIWQCDDHVPEFPRIHTFLDFWRQEVEAVISAVEVCYSNRNSIRKVDLFTNHTPS